MSRTNCIEVEEHLNVRATGGNRGSSFSWTIYNGSGHPIARSGRPFTSHAEAMVDARFTILTIKQASFDEYRAGKGSDPK